MDDLQNRTTGEVFEDHLRLAKDRAFDDDIARNFAADCVVLTGRGTFRGHDGLRQLARMLDDELPTGDWQYWMTLVEGNAAYLEWTGDAGDAMVDDGADSFFIADGKVIVQTIHYTIRDHNGIVLIGPDGKRPGGSD